jgi:hypothetical protein
MTDWKAVGTCALLNAVLTIILTFVAFPVSFLGPLIGGFLTSYIEDMKRMEQLMERFQV